MRRGEIYFAELSPTVGSEINKRRPALIVSNNANNRAANTITVVPLTSNTSPARPFEVLVLARQTGLPRDSKVLAQQIRTISKARVAPKKVGELDQALMQQVDAAIKLHLALR